MQCLFFRKLCGLRGNVEKCRIAGPTTDENIYSTCTLLAGWATETNSEYVKNIAFSLQQWLRERAVMLRLYVNCLSCLHRILQYNYSTVSHNQSNSWTQ